MATTGTINPTTPIALYCERWTSAMARVKPHFDGVLHVPSIEDDDRGGGDGDRKRHIRGGGRMGVILQFPGCADAVVKIGRHHKTGKACSLSPAESVATRLLWDLVAATGCSPHVLCPYGEVRVAVHGTPGLTSVGSVPPSLLSGSSSSSTPAPIRGLVMESLAGVRLKLASASSGPGAVPQRVVTLKALIEQGLAGGVTDFGKRFRAVVFQVVFTLVMAFTGSNGTFRHNDLHDENVCVDQVSYPSKVRYEYHSVSPKSATAPTARRPRVFEVETDVRSVIIDFGWAALSGPYAAANDKRFGARVLSAGHGATVAQAEWREHDYVAAAGMSNVVPSMEYDTYFFLSSVRNTIESCGFGSPVHYSTTKARPAGKREAERVISEFIEFYERVVGDLLGSDAMPVNGRLTLAAQLALAKGRSLTYTPSRGLRKGRQTQRVRVPCPLEMLFDPFFNAFAVADGTGEPLASVPRFGNMAGAWKLVDVSPLLPCDKVRSRDLSSKDTYPVLLTALSPAPVEQAPQKSSQSGRRSALPARPRPRSQPQPQSRPKTHSVPQPQAQSQQRNLELRHTTASPPPGLMPAPAPAPPPPPVAVVKVEDIAEPNLESSQSPPTTISTRTRGARKRARVLSLSPCGSLAKDPAVDDAPCATELCTPQWLRSVVKCSASPVTPLVCETVVQPCEVCTPTWCRSVMCGGGHVTFL